MCEGREDEKEEKVTKKEDDRMILFSGNVFI